MRTFLNPICNPPLTNEEILALFLKEHRKFKPVKDCIANSFPDITIDVDNALGFIPYEIFEKLEHKWLQLVAQFKLTGSVSYRELLKIR